MDYSGLDVWDCASGRAVGYSGCGVLVLSIFDLMRMLFVENVGMPDLPGCRYV